MKPTQNLSSLRYALSFLFCVFSSYFTTDLAQASPVTFEEDYSLPIVYLNLVTLRGVAHDPSNRLGLAAVGSQMLLRGTKSLSKEKFFDQLSSIGGSFEAEPIAEGMLLRLEVLSENIAPFLDLIEQAVLEPRFNQEELTAVKKEVESRILESRGRDKTLVQNHFYRFFYGDHPYGNSLLGTLAGVKGISMGDINNFYKTSFRPQGIRVFGSGAVPRSAIETWSQKLLGALEKHRAIDFNSELSEPKFSEHRRALLVQKPKATQSQVLLGGPGIRPEDKNFYPIQLANHSFGGGSFQARLMQELRVKRGWTYGAYNSFRLGKRRRHFAMYFFPKTSDTAPAIELSLKLMNDFIHNGITKDEFEFARSSLINNAPFTYDTARKRLENVTQEYLFQFPAGYFANFSKEIEKVSYDSIQPALQDFFRDDRLVLTVVGEAAQLRDKIKAIPGYSTVVEKSYLSE